MEVGQRQLVLSEPDFTIWKYHGIPEAGISFFETTNWGSAGMVYERKNSPDLIRQLKDPYLFAVQQAESIVGTAVFCHTRPLVQQTPINTYIIRYFAASDAIRGKKVIKRYAGKVMEAVREGETEKTIYVGCVEKGNARSFHIVSGAGYEVLGSLRVLAFSRFSPKPQTGLEQINTLTGRDEVSQLLTQYYKNHVLVHFDYLFLNDNYFVIRNEQHEIVAGCQFHRAHWAINHMPGLMGKFIMNALPNIPGLNRIFNPRRFEFLALEGLYLKPGHENFLHQLIEGLLHKEKLNSALIWVGENCPVQESLLRFGKLGLLQQFVKKSGVYIMTSYRNMDAVDIQQLKAGPLYASAFDYI